MTATPDPSATPAPEALPLRAQALLLDMDGTLIDSGPSVERAWDTLLAELGSDHRFGHAEHGRPARQILAEILPGLTAEELDRAHARIEELEIADVAGIRTLPGTERLLRELDAAAEQLGRPTWTIVTSCTRPLFEARWARTGLPTPAGLVTADQVAHGKPDPEPYLLGAERVGADLAETIVLEDSVGGLRSGSAAGARTVAVTTTTPAAELASRADALVTSLDDLEVSVADGALRLARRGA
ncbi:HAD-IA family hydrolase [Brachybacterium sp. J144]|uniref:HAD-IA family hydrolase n=1 Tax=Brachybacterium sp. J144 TaxID=3116487 RepID=UPI002E7840D6|nr:HAD-IA family hydrolase [Brachybacterium sp. J144]MEE1649197.1 HAD-IA family hydrolase [Brachybacterium sp. J144]